MARPAKFQVVRTEKGWRVNVPSKISITGKRQQLFFSTREKAQAHQTNLKANLAEHGRNALAIKPSLAEDATVAAQILLPWGMSLSEAARRVAATLEQENASKLLSDAASAWIDSMDGLRPRSIKSYEVTLNRLRNSLGTRTLSTLKAEEIQKAITTKETSSATYSMHRRNARAFWNWASKKGWCDKKVFDQVDTPRKSPDKEISFLTPQEAESILRIAEAKYPKAVAMYAVALFAGVRAEEIIRLDPAQVSATGIELSADVTKKGRRRHITPNETLRAWLTKYPFQNCPSWKEVDRACRRLAGWAVSAPILKDPLKPTKGLWPQNALRHSHASYAIAAGTPLERLLFEFGHVGGVEMLRKHYVGRATKQQAADFFAILPSD